jgi:hypothetical protein
VKEIILKKCFYKFPEFLSIMINFIKLKILLRYLHFIFDYSTADD